MAARVSRSANQATPHENKDRYCEPNGTIVNTGSGLCLDDAAAGGSGTNLIVYTCSGAAKQLWMR